MQTQRAILLRLFFGEDDKHEGKPLYKHIIELCKKEGIRGATVFRGIMGYGESSKIHSASPFKLSSDLPMVLEIIDDEENINRILPKLKSLIKGGLITSEVVQVIKT